ARGHVRGGRAGGRPEAGGQAAVLAWTLLGVGEVRLLAGEPAAEPGSRALTLFRAHQERGGEAYALRLLGEVEARRGDASPASALFEKSERLAHELGMKPLAARCGLLLAMRPRPGESLRVDVSSRLAASVATLEALGMEHWTKHVEPARNG